MSLEFQVSVPSVLTVLLPSSLVAFMNILVMVTLLEWDMKECQNWGCDQDKPLTNKFVEL